MEVKTSVFAPVKRKNEGYSSLLVRNLKFKEEAITGWWKIPWLWQSGLFMFGLSKNQIKQLLTTILPEHLLFKIICDPQNSEPLYGLPSKPHV